MRYYFSLWGVFVGIFWLLFWVGLIWLAVSIARGRRHEGHGPFGHESPGRYRALEVLEERYARGEISREEFLERRAVLGWAPPPQTYSPPPTQEAPPPPPDAPTAPAEPSTTPSTPPSTPPAATETAPLPPPAEEPPPTSS